MKTKRAGIYVRVFTGEQDTAMQEAELKECVNGVAGNSRFTRIMASAEQDRAGPDWMLFLPT